MPGPLVKMDLGRLEIHGIAAIRGAYLTAKSRRDQADAEVKAIEEEARRALGDRLPDGVSLSDIEIRNDEAWIQGKKPEETK